MSSLLIQYIFFCLIEDFCFVREVNYGFTSSSCRVFVAHPCNQIQHGAQIRTRPSASHVCCLKITLAIYNCCLCNGRGNS